MIRPSRAVAVIGVGRGSSTQLICTARPSSSWLSWADDSTKAKHKQADQTKGVPWCRNVACQYPHRYWQGEWQWSCTGQTKRKFPPWTQYKHSHAWILQRHSSGVNLTHHSCIGASTASWAEDSEERFDWPGLSGQDVEGTEEECPEVWAAISWHRSLRWSRAMVFRSLQFQRVSLYGTSTIQLNSSPWQS